MLQVHLLFLWISTFLKYSFYFAYIFSQYRENRVKKKKNNNKYPRAPDRPMIDHGRLSILPNGKYDHGQNRPELRVLCVLLRNTDGQSA